LSSIFLNHRKQLLSELSFIGYEVSELFADVLRGETATVSKTVTLLVY